MIALTEVGLPGSRKRALDVEWFWSTVYTALAVAALLGIWEGLARILEVPLWLVPKPSDFVGPRCQIRNANPVGAEFPGIFLAANFRRGSQIRQRIGDC